MLTSKRSHGQEKRHLARYIPAFRGSKLRRLWPKAALSVAGLTLATAGFLGGCAAESDGDVSDMMSDKSGNTSSKPGGDKPENTQEKPKEKPKVDEKDASSSTKTTTGETGGVTSTSSSAPETTPESSGAKKDSSSSSKPAPGGHTEKVVDIPGADGTAIPATVLQPKSKGPHPLVVLPASWTCEHTEYVPAVRKWADEGFVVISYTSRGFGGQKGEIDISGPLTVDDISAVIDWAGRHTSADLKRVGAAGISYGAGSSLLAAAKDSRIKAVVSMSGWGNLRDAMFPKDTLSLQAAQFLTSTAKLTGRPGPVLKRFTACIDDLAACIEGDEWDKSLELMKDRSVEFQLDALNAKKPAVYIVHGWNDGIFPVSQMVRLYEKLKGPRKLMVAPGDHSSVEQGGIFGLPNEGWDSALAWMKHYVAGDTKVDTGPEVVSISNDHKARHEAKSWEALAGKMTSVYLTQPKAKGLAPKTGQMSKTKVAAWQESIDAKIETVADSGSVWILGNKHHIFGTPQTASIDFVNRQGAMVWRGEAVKDGFDIIGTPKIRFTMTPQLSKVTVIAYLFEEVLGTGGLITYQPFTVRDIKPGKPVEVELDFEPTDWNVAAGSRLVVVIDTLDKRYRSESEAGGIAFSSTDSRSIELSYPKR